MRYSRGPTMCLFRGSRDLFRKMEPLSETRALQQWPLRHLRLDLPRIRSYPAGRRVAILTKLFDCRISLCTLQHVGISARSRLMELDRCICCGEDVLEHREPGNVREGTNRATSVLIRTNTIPQSLDLSLLGASGRSFVNHNTCRARLGTCSTLRSGAITSSLAPSTLFTGKPGLLSNPGCH